MSLKLSKDGSKRRAKESDTGKENPFGLCSNRLGCVSGGWVQDRHGGGGGEVGRKKYRSQSYI